MLLLLRKLCCAPCCALYLPKTLHALQRVLHTVLQIAAAMLLSLINGVVASPFAFGPLATTYHALFTATVPEEVPVLFWMRAIAAAGMGCGIVLWSHRLVAALGGCCVRRCRPPLVDTKGWQGHFMIWRCTEQVTHPTNTLLCSRNFPSFRSCGHHSTSSTQWLFCSCNAMPWASFCPSVQKPIQCPCLLI